MNPYEALIRSIYAFSKDPKVSNVTEILFPLVNVISAAKGKTTEEIIDEIGFGLDNLIGSEDNALITGPNDLDSPIKIDIPLIDEDGKAIEFSSDVLISIIKKIIRAKLNAANNQ